MAFEIAFGLGFSKIFSSNPYLETLDEKATSSVRGVIDMDLHLRVLPFMMVGGFFMGSLSTSGKDDNGNPTGLNTFGGGGSLRFAPWGSCDSGGCGDFFIDLGGGYLSANETKIKATGGGPLASMGIGLDIVLKGNIGIGLASHYRYASVKELKDKETSAVLRNPEGSAIFTMHEIEFLSLRLTTGVNGN
jgi:hypothetical protein